MMKNYAILIPSCDKFADLWDPFFTLFFRYWGGVKNPVYLISNSLDYNDSRVTVLKVGPDKSWAETVQRAVDKIPETALLVILEDFLFTGLVDTIKLESYFKIFCRLEAGYLRLLSMPAPDVTYKDHPDIGYIAPGASYRTSLQVAFWNKPTLQKLLVKGESPWNFEIIGSRRSDTFEEAFLSVNGTEPPPIPYFPNAVIRGVWALEAADYCRSQNIILDEAVRPIETAFQQWGRRLPFRRWLAQWCFIPIRRFLGRPVP